MKGFKRVFSLLLTFMLLAVYLFPASTLVHATSLSDYTGVTTFVDNNLPVSESLSQGVQVKSGSQYLTVTTTDTYDPYFTVDLIDTSLKNKIIAIKFKATADTHIANAFIYPESSAGGWGTTGAGVLSSSAFVCDGTWNVATYNIAHELFDDSDLASEAQSSATIHSLRIGGVATNGGTLQVAYIGVFDDLAQCEKYDELFCNTYTSVKLDKPTIIPNASYSIDSEFYNFQESAVTNDLKLIGSKTNVNIDWVYREGANNSKFVVEGSNKYLKLSFDSFAHSEIYANNVSYFFSADVRPEDKADHFAGFIFNYAYENAWKENMFYESNGTDKENCVSKSGIGVNIFPSMIIVYVVCYDINTGSLKRIEYIHTLDKNIDDSFHNFKAIDNANGTIRFLLDDELFAYVEYSNPGSMPASAKKHFEYYYRTAKIYNGEGELEASATDAMVAYIKSLAAGSRARAICLDNLTFSSLGSALPSVSLDKTNVTENDNITAKINYGDYLVNDLYLGIYNEGEECEGTNKVSPSYKVELDIQKNITLPKFMPGKYYAVIMSGNKQYGSKINFTVTNVAQNNSVYIQDTEAKVGTTVKIPIVLNNNPGIKDISIKILWNGNDFIPVNASNGIILNAASFNAAKTDSSYTLSWTGTTDTTAKGILGYIELEVKNDTPLGKNSINIQVLSAASKKGNITSSLTAGNGSIKVKDTTLKISGVTLSISNDISVLYYVKKAQFDKAGYTDPYIMAELNQVERKLLPSQTNINGELCYVFKFEHLAPQRMNDQIQAVIFAKLGDEIISSSSISYGVCTYAYRMLEKTTDHKFRTLLVDMLNYGEASQIYGDYNLDNLVNAALTAQQKSWGTSALRKLNSVTEVINKSDSDMAKWTTMTLVLKNNITIQGTFTAEKTDGIYVKVEDASGNVVTNIYSSDFIYDGNKINIRFQKLNATQLSDVYYFTVCNQDGEAISGTCKYSVESYVNSAQSFGNDKLKSLASTIIKYGDAAKAYTEDNKTAFSQLEPIFIGTSFYANISYQGKYLNVSGSNVDIQTPNGISNQYWKFNYQPDGSYEIINLMNGYALDVDNALDSNFTNVHTYSANDTKAQRWFIYLIDGQYVFRSAISEVRVLDVYSALSEDGTNIDIYEFNDTDAQKFKVENMTGNAIMYHVTSPYNEASARIATYTSLNEAKALADQKSHYGYVVYTSLGKLVHVPTSLPSFNAAKILWNAKQNADYARTHGYIYGDASVNPALDKSERVVSCDRFVGWTLYDAGFNRNGQPSTKGYTLYTTNNLEQLLISLGFTKITNMSSVAGGDVIFVGDSHSLAVPSNYKDYPRHVFIAAGFHSGSNYYRYDAGSNGRLQSVQPSIEPLSYPDMQFRFAYRAPAN